MFEAFYLLNSRYILSPVLSLKGLTENRYVPIAILLVVLFQLLYTYTPPMQALFGSTALDAQQWMLIVLVSVVGVCLSWRPKNGCCDAVHPVGNPLPSSNDCEGCGRGFVDGTSMYPSSEMRRPC